MRMTEMEMWGVVLILTGMVQLLLPTNAGSTIVAAIWFVVSAIYIHACLRQ